MDIAIIGLSCKLPGADNQNEFWRNLVDNKSSVEEIPVDRWDWKKVWGDPKQEPNKTNSRWGGFIKNADTFDHEFFGLIPKVVEAMDPQQRIMLEQTWKCFEDAGIDPASVRGEKIGLVFSAFNHDYKELQEQGQGEIEAHHSTGNAAAIIANRVSHYFDFKGPSLSIDTACSGSLNAIHCAVQALNFGDCDMALAGGINLILTPTRHISFSKMGMMSPTGTCRTFDDSANGYVRGEGAGVLLLKPLQQAQADGDSIYGVIKGTAVNHCGETYTLTYPSPDAQANVIIEAHERAGTAIDSISYIEAHGTGTPKGDPIEFKGLQQAFAALAKKQGLTLEQGQCSLGSVKTNIGHLEAAAGVAGVIKVLMQFRHQQLAAINHFKTLNHRIALDESPFYIQQENQRWLPSQGKQALPMRAGVSSFGFGGTNAHIVLEQAPDISLPGARSAARKLPVYPILLSAKSEQALQARVDDLKQWLNEQVEPVSLLDLSFTLCTGRQAMKVRAAWLVESVQELQEKLSSFSIKESRAVEPLKCKDTEQTLARIAQSKKTTVARQLADIEVLVSAFCRGVSFSWCSLFSRKKARRIPLPTYPFSKNSFWLTSHDSDVNTVEPKLHPLLHKNISSFDCQAFSANFTGQEFFLADHKVNQQAVLPGAAYLEMIARAIQESISSENGERDIKIKDISWLRPLVMSDRASAIGLSLYPLVSGVADKRQYQNFNCRAEIEFEIASTGVDGERVVHCEGTAAVGETLLSNQDLSAEFVRALKLRESTPPVSRQTFYQLMDKAGLNYGPAHQSVKALWYEENRVIVHLALDESLESSHAQFGLHPALLDGAIQAGVALGWQAERGPELWREPEALDVSAKLPFLLQEIDLAGPMAKELLAIVSLDSTGESMHSVSIALANLDDKGQISNFPARLTGLSLKGQARSASKKSTEIATAEDQSVNYAAYLNAENAEGYYAPAWQSVATELSAETEEKTIVLLEDVAGTSGESLANSLRGRGHTVVRVQTGEVTDLAASEPVKISRASEQDIRDLISQYISEGVQPDALIHLAYTASNNAEPVAAEYIDIALQSGVNTLFPLTRSLMKLAKKLRLLTVVENAPHSRPEHLGLSGFYKTLQLEKPRFSGKVIQLPSQQTPEQAGALLESELATVDTFTDVAYWQDIRHVRVFEDALPVLRSGINHQHRLDIDDSSLMLSTAFVSQGVYLITGGMGALGLIFARHLMHAYSAQVYLTGRSEQNDKHQAILDELNRDQTTARAFYLPCDVGSRSDVVRVTNEIREQSGRIDGVLHAAGVIEDDFIIKKSCESFNRVITPKVAGTINLDAATANDKLHSFILFSSVTGALGNLGQCDYGFGNAFEDYFSLYRNQLSTTGKRSGRALSVNWPYWRNGGMSLTDKEEEILNRNFGIVPLETDAGIKALETALSLPLSQLAVLPGDNKKVRQVLGCTPSADAQSKSEAQTDLDAENLRSDVIDYLIELFARELKVSRERFTLDGSFQEFGFDSVVMLDLVNCLEKRFSGIPKTLFFENQSINELADFLVENYAQEIAQGDDAGNSAPGAAFKQSSENHSSRSGRQRVSVFDEKTTAKKDTRIAIVGLAGRYPEANDLQTFWKNLSEGKDCIREIPADRWDLGQVFQAGAPRQGKSYSKWGGFLSDVDKFDALYFNISPKEAEKLDPQERLFLETVAHAIDDAGYNPAHLAPQHGLQENPVGVYAGVMWGDYQLHGIESSNPEDWVTPHSFYWSVANRISYFFNFSGPSITLDTACSSSLTAIHLACNALVNDEIKVAIAGGVNLSIHANKYNLLSDMHFLSSDGRCRSFGEGGDGYVPAEGVGAVVLKPLADAERDGDFIYGVIRGTAVNHGGKTSGFTVPNPNRQGSLIQQAMNNAGVTAEEISYIEAHGTGTSLGDPIEISGLTQAFKTDKNQYCAIGSAKSNIGHAEAAAGIAGLTKVLLQMKHRKLAPSIHSQTLNPYLELNKTPFSVNQQLQDWPRPVIHSSTDKQKELPRIAGISSFGAGGANGHILVEEYLAHTSANEQERPVIIPLSARKPEALKAMAENLAGFLRENPDISLSSLAFTLQTGRVEHEWRLAAVVNSVAECEKLLARFGAGEKPSQLLESVSSVRASGQIRADVSDKMSAAELRELAQGWINGDKVSWQGFYTREKPARVPLPGYAYQRQRYWIDKPEAGAKVRGIHPVLEENISNLQTSLFRTRFRSSAFYLQDHQINGHRVLPGVVYLEMAWQAVANALPGHRMLGFYDVEWLQPTVVDKGSSELTIRIDRDSYGYIFEIFGAPENAIYCRGAIASLPAVVTNSDGVVEPLSDDSVLVRGIRKQLGIDTLEQNTFSLNILKDRMRSLSIDALDDRFEAMGFDFGERFKPFVNIHCNDLEAIAELKLPAAATTECEAFELNPVLMDAALRTSLAIGGHQGVTTGETPLPVKVSRLQWLRPLEASLFVYAVRKPQEQGLAARETYDIHLLNAAGEVLLYMEGFTTHRVNHFLAHLSTENSQTRPTAQIEKSKRELPLAEQSAPVAGVDAEAAALHFMKSILAEQTRLDYQQIDAAESVATYGVDSVMIHALNTSLSERFGDEVSKTLFYEFSSIGEIAQHLAESFPQACATLAGDETPIPGEKSEDKALSANGIDEPSLQNAIRQFVRSAIADITKLPESDISETEPFEHFGIDSVMIHSLNEKFATVFGTNISKTLFYEYNDLAGVSDYFYENHADDAQRNLAASISVGAVEETEQATHAAVQKKDTSVPAPSDAANSAPLLVYLVQTVSSLSRASGDIAELHLDKLQLDDVDLIKLAHRWRKDLSVDIARHFYSANSLHALAQQLMQNADISQAIAKGLLELQKRTVSENPHGEVSTGAGLQSQPAQNSVHPQRPILQRLLSGMEPAAHRMQQEQDDDIAIIGVSGRYPLADNLDEFWQNLAQGRDCIREVPVDRWDNAQVFDSDRNNRGKVYSKWGGFMDGVDQFDAELFKMTRREAEIVDPQERLFLQTAWQCLEDAAYTRSSLSDNNVGVFVGVMWGHYELIDVSEAQTKLGRPSASFSSIANRVSYHFDFNGPSLALDSMCSSSLSAIHTACQSIRFGDCDYAIAGGVNVASHVTKYQLLCQQQFLSDDGRCRAFGEGGSGYVPGEGVGAVLLKPMKQAIADGDNIYAVIKGSALNHGGKTSGFTVPNQARQASVIGKALERSGWSADDIQYIEAHGTGTSLGDPIELSGLKKALAPSKSENSHWYLGSVKSNIGHLESAAGIAGLSKILLQMKAGKIAPSLHSQTLNPNLAIENSGFHIPQNLLEWPRAKDSKGVEQPRRAGISSFGAGGSNAHVLIEEFIAVENAPLAGVDKGLFILSADSEERLSKYVSRIVNTISTLSQQQTDHRQLFHKLCYTSLVGRDARDWRMAVVCDSLDDLHKQLSAWLSKQSPAGVYTGEARARGAKLDSLLDEDTSALVLESLFRKERLQHLAAAWVAALDINWRKHIRQLYPEQLPTRLSLPSQPLVTESFWVEQAKPGNELTIAGLHPLLDSNDSTISRQSFRKLFKGDEFYLRDHVVENNGPQVILPGVAYLEMARAAAQISVPNDYQVRKIRNVVWLKPIQLINEPCDVSLTLASKGIGLEYRVQDAETEQQCFSTGDIAFALKDVSLQPEKIDIESIRAMGGVMESKKEIYHLFSEMGFRYGPAYQVTEWRQRMPNAALAKLRLPAALVANSQDFVIHPSLMDGALRTCLGIGDANYVSPMVPFALGEIEIFSALTQECYVYATVAGEKQASANGESAQVVSYNLVVTDSSGRVLVKVKDISARGLGKKGGQSTGNQLSSFHYQWQPVPQTVGAGGQVPKAMLVLTESIEKAEAYAESFPDAKTVIVNPDNDLDKSSGAYWCLDLNHDGSVRELIENLDQQSFIPELIVNDTRYAHGSDNIRQALKYSVLLAYRLFRAVSEIWPNTLVRYVDLQPGNPFFSNPFKAAVSGFGNSMVANNHLFQTAVLSVEKGESTALPINYLAAIYALGNINGNEYRFEGDTMEQRKLSPLVLNASGNSTLSQLAGKVIITGGLGKLGLATAEYLIDRQCPAIALVSRKQPSEAQQRRIDQIIEKAVDGQQIIHLCADVAKKESVDELFTRCKESLGTINTVIHAAGYATDLSIFDVDEDEFCKSLQAKIDGTLHLLSACEDGEVANLVTFSSISVALGDLGTGSYAAGNRFMDEMAAIQEKLRSDKTSPAKTKLTSINWPLWASGGMQIPDNELAALQFSGMAPMPEDIGLQALADIFTSDYCQVFLSYGNRKRFIEKCGIDNAFLSQAEFEISTPEGSAETEAVPSRDSTLEAERETMDQENIRAKVQAFVCKCVADITRQDATKIQADRAFESFGMDSVLLMELQKKLAESVQGLSKTILFEYDCVNTLSDYLVREKLGEISANFGWQRNDEKALTGSRSPAGLEKVNTSSASYQQASLNKFEQNDDGCVSIAHLFNKTELAQAEEVAPLPKSGDIAVIGMAGHFPGAKDLQEFWHKVKHGKNCISPVPKERWKKYLGEGDSHKHLELIEGKWGGFVDGVDHFDYPFFGLSKLEAAKMDPQLRLLMQTAWQAIEDAAYCPSQFRHKNIGVYVGAMNNDHSNVTGELLAKHNAYFGPGTVDSELANRLSYLFDVRGPSLTVKTACSSSLTALHMASTAIQNGECEMAIVAGVNLSLHPHKYLLLQDMKVLSDAPVEKTFDRDADGLIPSEGVGVVVLKAADSAEHDKDNIHGIINATAVSHSGVGAGQFIPNLKVLEGTIQQCLDKADIEKASLRYIESHGTATALGDPIELKALENIAIKNNLSQLMVGTKANLGHMEAASGICSLIKVLCSFKESTAAPCANLLSLSDALSSDTPLVFPRQAEMIAEPNTRYYAGINSFGMGGSNAFALVQKPGKVRAESNTQAGIPLLLLSADSPEQLRVLAADYQKLLVDHHHLNAVLYSSQVGRSHRAVRLAIAAEDCQQLTEVLARFVSKQDSTQAFYLGDTYRDDTSELIRQLATTATLQQLYNDKNWQALAELWLRGASIDWDAFYASKPYRTSLPNYPFARLNCSIDSAVDDIREVERKKRVNLSLVSANESGIAEVDAGDDGDSWYHVPCIKSVVDAQYTTMLDEHCDSDQKSRMYQQYWQQYLADVNGKPALLLDDQAGEQVEAEYHLEKTLHGDSLNELRKFSRIHRLELTTLAVAAWSLLISRRAKTPAPLIAITRFLNVSQKHTHSDSGATCLFPMATSTQVRGKCVDWLLALQSRMNKNHLFARQPGNEPSPMAYLQRYDLHNSFNTGLRVGVAEKPDSEDAINTEICASVVEKDERLVLSLDASAATLSETMVTNLLNDFAQVLVQLPAFADKNPAAIPVGSTRRKRLSALKRMEEA